MNSPVIYAFDDFEFDAERLELRRHGAVVKADTVVLRVLAALVRNAGRLVTKEELVDEVWARRAVADNVITVSMARLRKTLHDKRDARELVVTVYGRGYRFVCPVETRSASAPELRLAPVLPDAPPPLVGRARVLERLREALAEAQLGRGRLCVLMGEPGIGKTRVVKALTEELAGTPTQVGWGFCREAGSTPPLYPWLSLLRVLFESEPDDEVDRRLGPLAADLRGLLVESDQLVSDHAQSEVQTCSRGRSRLRNFGVITRAFVRIAQTTSWVLVLDDLHRADAASLELLSLLVDEIAHTRLLVIATARETLGGRTPRPETPLPYILGHGNTERIALERLSEAEVEQYVGSITDDVGGRLGRAVFAKSQGNPFFMTELARQLQSDPPPDPDALSLPSAALDIVRQRVAELHPDTRAVLTSAAVIGSRFELSLLQTLTGKEPSEIMAALDEAIAVDFVVAAPDSVTGFAFGHELLRTVLYEGIPASERRRRHLETARALEQRVAAHDPVPVSELADHFYAAMPDTDLQKTIHYCEAAARAGMTVFANTDIARHLRHALSALQLLPNPSVRHRTALLTWIAVFTRGSASDVFIASITEAVRLARQCGDAKTLVRAALMYHVHPELVSLPGASAALEHALTILTPEQTAHRAMALAALATCTPNAFSARRAHACLAEAEALARGPGGDEGIHLVLVCKLFTEGGPAPGRKLERIIDELEQISIRKLTNAPMVPMFLTIHRTVRCLQEGQIERVHAAVERGAAGARKLRHPEMLWHFERFRALLHLATGAFETGTKLLDALHRQVAHHPIHGTEVFCAFDRVAVLSELGGSPVAKDDDLRRALAVDGWDPPGIVAMKVRALAVAGLRDEARSALARIAPEDIAELPVDSQYLGTLGHLARAALLLGLREYAEALLRAFGPYGDYFAASAAFQVDGAVPQLVGMLLRMLGRNAEAQLALERGIGMNEGAGFVMRAAETRLELAQCLLASGGRDALHSANILAREALTAGDRLGLERISQTAARFLEIGPSADMLTN